MATVGVKELADVYDRCVW